jgi:hypothetical protein
MEQNLICPPPPPPPPSTPNTVMATSFIILIFLRGADRGFVYISQKGGGDGANSNDDLKKLVLLYFGFFYISQSIFDLLGHVEVLVTC